MATTIDAENRKFALIYDQNGTVILSIRDVSFEEKSNAFLGHAEQVNMTSDLRMLILEIEDRLDHLSLAYVDEIQEKIDSFNLTAVLQDGTSLKIKDLYLSSDGGVSFRRNEPTSQPMRLAVPTHLEN